MFDNIGGKIKSLAKIVAWIGIICSVIVGVIGMFQPVAAFGTNINGILPGVIVIVIGALSSWIGSWVMYGFGQLIENTDKLAGK
ncbi:MAG: hypothetical protein PHI27_08700 [Eubacteriales bacterium]|nr:hypothetical protein [Eubacteriales bacterium]MDD3882318.1 hypothetical protein [Eubacteriales bacterium]MDD4512064.1 hypothetical protein [Eubacteriales bacterium]